jgi:hypothetical protein
MVSAKKFLVFAVVLACTSTALLSRLALAEGGDKGIACLIDVVVESKNQAGTVVSREVYSKAFTIDEGETFFDDFSTRTRFKFFTANMTKVDGEKNIAINWFADVTVFNSVDLDTAVSLADGQKTGKATGRHTLYVSGGSTTTTYTLSCNEN